VQQQSTTISQKIEIGAGIAFTVCLPVMVFLRHKMGYRFISQPRLMIMAALLFVIATLGAFLPIGANIYFLYIFLLAFLVLGFIERRLRWRDIKRGISWHSRSRGISWINKILPTVPDSIMKRFIDPAVVFAVGLLFLFFIQELTGIYLLIAALCMFAWESYDYERSINLMLDQLDNLIDSEVMSQNIDYYGQDGKPLPARSIEETSGIPTGISPELTTAIARKQFRASGRITPAPAMGAPSMQAGFAATQTQQPAPGVTATNVAVAVEDDPLPTSPAKPVLDNLVMPASPPEENP
jgi:hypothetical protein